MFTARRIWTESDVTACQFYRDELDIRLQVQVKKKFLKIETKSKTFCVRIKKKNDIHIYMFNINLWCFEIGDYVMI